MSFSTILQAKNGTILKSKAPKNENKTKTYFYVFYLCINSLSFPFCKKLFWRSYKIYLYFYLSKILILKNISMSFKNRLTAVEVKPIS